jgi:hypothetical protein
MSGRAENTEIRLYLSKLIPFDKDNMDEYECTKWTSALNGHPY